MLRTYNAAGAQSTRTTFAADVASGANQSTMLMATPEAEAQFGFTADATDLALRASSTPAAGRVCWEDARLRLLGQLQRLAAQPGRARRRRPRGIPDGMALRRKIAPGCATLLEPGDDHDNSAADFSAVFPGPRPNSVAPTEHACGGGGGRGRRRQSRPGRAADDAQGQAGEAGPRPHPDLPLLRRRGRARPSNASSTASRSEPAARPSRRSGSALGRHTFKVRARGDGRPSTPRPASFAFKVLAQTHAR